MPLRSHDHKLSLPLAIGFLLSFPVQLLLGTLFTFMKDLQFNYQRDTERGIT